MLNWASQVKKPKKHVDKMIDGDIIAERGNVAMSTLMSVTSSATEGLIIMKSVSLMIEKIFKVKLSDKKVLKPLVNEMWPKIVTGDFDSWLHKKDIDNNANLIEKGKSVIGALRCLVKTPFEAHAISKTITYFLEKHGPKTKVNTKKVRGLAKRLWPGNYVEKLEIAPIDPKTGMPKRNEAVIYRAGEKIAAEKEQNIMYG